MIREEAIKKRNIKQRLGRQTLEFIGKNIKTLGRVRNGEKHIEITQSLLSWKENFTPKQLSLIDSLYEKLMEGFGEKSFKPTYKPKRKY